MLRTLSLLEKHKTNIDDIGGKRRHSQNMLQWCKNDFKNKKSTNEDYSWQQNNIWYLGNPFPWCISRTYILYSQKQINLVGTFYILTQYNWDLKATPGPVWYSDSWQLCNIQICEFSEIIINLFCSTQIKCYNW